MTDVLLIQPPVSFTNKLANSGRDSFPIGLAYVTAVLKRDGFSVRTINNADAAYSIAELLALIESETVKLVGFSTLLATIPATVQMAKAIKAKFADRVHVLMGNSYASIDTGIVDRYPFFDSVILGEAECMVSNHVARVLRGERVAGIFKADAPDNLDALPFPDYENIENTFYQKGCPVPIIGTRGCPYQCGYCARQALSKKVRCRSASNIVDEMISRAAWTNHFNFQDDAATINRKHVLSLCQEIIKRDVKVHFEMTTRLDLVDDEMVQMLKKAGCDRLIVGVESGSERIRNDVIRKNLSDASIHKGMEITCRNKMPVQLMFMVGHPEETEAELLSSVNMPVNLEKMGFSNIEAVGYHITLPIPGTKYFDWCVAKGQFSPAIVDDYISGKLGDGYFGHWPYLIPEGFTHDDMLRFRKMAAQRFHLRLSFVLRKAWQDIKNPKQLLIDVKHAYYVLKQGTSSDVSKTET